MTNEKIPFNKPFIIGGELFNIARAVIEYSDLSGDGVYTRTCQEWFQKKLGCDKALLTHSCTAALEMAAILCDIKPGDEVIILTTHAPQTTVASNYIHTSPHCKSTSGSTVVT